MWSTAVLLGCSVVCAESAAARWEATRFVSYNIEDLRASEIADAGNEQANAAIEVIASLRPDVLLVNELQYDGALDAQGCVKSGTAAHAFAARMEAAHPELKYQVVVAPVNTGVPSGLDLDRDGKSNEPVNSRKYGNDCLGFGWFPGQYGMAVFVREGIAVDWAGVRTFRSFKWKDMPGALLPTNADGTMWYDEAALDVLPLSSKSHWDVPIVLEDGSRVHVLVSHPTPPVFDGREDRNGKRNHDEIRFWAEYLNGVEWIVDDAGVGGGLAKGEAFVVMGDLNADPEQGDSVDNAIGQLLGHARVRKGAAPEATSALEDEHGAITSSFGLRVDYVLASAGAEVVAQGVYWRAGDGPEHGGAAVDAEVVSAASDHHPVWVELVFPEAGRSSETRDE